VCVRSFFGCLFGWCRLCYWAYRFKFLLCGRWGGRLLGVMFVSLVFVVLSGVIWGLGSMGMDLASNGQVYILYTCSRRLWLLQFAIVVFCVYSFVLAVVYACLSRELFRFIF